MLGMTEWFLLMFGVWVNLWIPIYSCESETQTVSSFIGIYLIVIAFDAFRRATKKGFYLGYFISVTAILSSIWFFYVSQWTIKDYILYGSIVMSATIDIVRTKMSGNSHNGTIWFDRRRVSGE